MSSRRKAAPGAGARPAKSADSGFPLQKPGLPSPSSMQSRSQRTHGRCLGISGHLARDGKETGYSPRPTSHETEARDGRTSVRSGQTTLWISAVDSIRTQKHQSTTVDDLLGHQSSNPDEEEIQLIPGSAPRVSRLG